MISNKTINSLIKYGKKSENILNEKCNYSDMNYNIYLIKQNELTIDIGDLEGIVHQLEAITQGWGMDFSVVEVEYFAGMDGYILEGV